jgi:hypothetical protein
MNECAEEGFYDILVGPNSSKLDKVTIKIIE